MACSLSLRARHEGMKQGVERKHANGVATAARKYIVRVEANGPSAPVMEERKGNKPALKSMRHSGNERAATDDEDRLKVFPDLFVTTGSARTVEYRDVEWKFARLEAFVCPA